MEEAKIEHLKGLSVINAAKHLMSKYGLNHEEATKNFLIMSLLVITKSI